MFFEDPLNVKVFVRAFQIGKLDFFHVLVQRNYLLVQMLYHTSLMVNQKDWISGQHASQEKFGTTSIEVNLLLSCGWKQWVHRIGFTQTT